MKAMICTQYGAPEVLQLANVDKPRPTKNQILVKVIASSVTTADTMMRTGFPLIGRLFIGLRRPRHPITGTGFAGIVESTGPDTTTFNVGDRVFGESTFGAGSNAEYVCLAEDAVVSPMPENLGFAQAAPLCDGFLTAYHFLHNLGQIKPQHKVLINGAAGSLGTAAVQLARVAGAQVTAVCSAGNHTLVRRLGADHAIDYANTDFAATGESYDIIFDTVGKRRFADCRAALTPNGRYLSPVLGLRYLWSVLSTVVSRQRALFAATGTLEPTKLRRMLSSITALFANRQLITVLDRQYQLDEVPAAHRHIHTGHKRGNIIVITG